MSGHGVDRLLRAFVAGVWIFHGLYSKLLEGVPRHQQIVERVLGLDDGAAVTSGIGLLEIGLGGWVFTGRLPRLAAAVQTVAILAMNALEILLAKDLLLSPTGMVVLNTAFLALGWYVAIRQWRKIQKESQPT